LQLIPSQLFLDPSCLNSDVEEYRKAQLAAWEAKVAPTLERRKKAVSIVLRFKADMHAGREARVADTMRRLVDPAFPRELLLTVIEAAIGSRSLHWKPSDEYSLEMQAFRFFRWPRGINHNTQIILRQTVASVLLRSFLMTLSTKFTPEGKLVIPHGLQRNSMSRWHLRRLVLKPQTLNIGVGEGLCWLRGDIDGVKYVENLFPRLETCICLVHIRLPWGWRGHILRAEEIMMKERLVEFIAAFQRDGPGKRKLIRLNLDGDVGPLVTLNHNEASDVATSGLGSGDIGDGKDAFALSAGRILQKAYVFPKVVAIW
jgi:hypothetical protein